MNWNIQNLGPTKSGMNYGNYDIVSAVSKIVVSNNIDLFIILEINTTRDGTAGSVMGIMQNALNYYSSSAGFANGYKTGILSSNTGREFYGFFIRDTALLRPLPLTGPALAMQFHSLGGMFFPAPANGEFTKVDIPPGKAILTQRFPLMNPDLKRRAASRSFPIWPGTRLPCLGLFEVVGAAPDNRFLPVFACHYASNTTTATQQVKMLPFFSVLRGLAPNPTPPAPANTPLNLQIRNAPNGPLVPYAMNQAIVTGDFNIDFFRKAANYDRLTQATAPSLGFPGYLPALGSEPPTVPENTHLVTFSNFSQRVQKSTKELAVSAYDNFFVRGRAAAGGAFPPPPAAAGGGNRRITSVSVLNVPELVRTRAVNLNASVQHYRELDQRGFVASKSYLSAAEDFANQLAGDEGNMINLQGSLIGGRLISDHLPVVMDVQLA